MREILFRGKRIAGHRDGTKDGTMMYGSLFVDKNGQPKIKWYNEQYGTSITSNVNPNTVGQFIGLLDKNGKKIFEGDIVLRSGITWLIAFEKNAFVCKDNTMRTYFALWEQWEYNWKSAEDISPSDAFEVIGNIHDNPELLV